MSIEVVFNIMLEERNDKVTVRYYQIGVLDEDGFSGCARDYVGGGEFDELIFVKGATVEEFLDEDDIDGDISEDTLNEHKPGVLDAVSAFMEAHFEFLDEAFLIAPKAPLLKLFEDAGADFKALLSNCDELEPLEIGNTSFF